MAMRKKLSWTESELLRLKDNEMKIPTLAPSKSTDGNSQLNHLVADQQVIIVMMFMIISSIILMFIFT
jgi:hypothetical protein